MTDLVGVESHTKIDDHVKYLGCTMRAVELCGQIVGNAEKSC